MALITSRTSLSQGASSSESVAWTSSSGANTTLTGTGLPVVAANDFFEIRNSPLTNNNGLYIATGSPTTSSVPCTKVSGADPSDDTSETVTWLGDTTTYKSVFFDTAGLECYLLEKGNLSVDGVTGQAIYSFMMQEWKDDNFLIANAPFPMFAIDSDAGKYIMGQDASGNNNGWNWADNATHSIRTRKLLRNMGWDEVNSSGTITARYVGVVTLGAFEDTANDTAYYQFGNDTTTSADAVDFDFAGPVNEAVEFYTLIGDLSGSTPSFATTTTITRATGSFVTDGFKVGGQITVAGSTSNDGTYELSAVSALSMTITTTWTAEAWGTTTVAVNNDNNFTLRLRIRDADPNGKTFGQANLASAGKTALGNFVYAFPLANATDLKIAATDLQIDSDTNNVPDGNYAGMTITYHSTGQAKTGLIGGSKNFGIVIEANGGTAQEVYEFVQWSLRGTFDIDAGAGTNIGRTMDGLMRFVGDTLEVGSTDGGLTFPTNPEGGGTGVFIDNIAAADKNNVKFWDNTQPGTPLSFPETIAVTCDFNATLEGDVAAEFDLFYDRTVRTNVTDFVITTTAGGTISSAGTNLPNNADVGVGSYIRVSGLTAGDAAMNGVYQIVTETTPGASWVVTRYDGAAIVAVSSTTADLDQHPIDTPDAIIVDTDNSVTDTTISFTSPDTIGDTNSGLGIFASGDRIRISGTVNNDGVYTVDTAAAGTVTLIEQTITTESAGSSFTLTEVASGTATADFSFSYDFDNNVQGGRTVSTTTFVKGKAIGATGAQYTESTVQQIASGTPLTIPFTSQIERNYA